MPRGESSYGTDNPVDGMLFANSFVSVSANPIGTG
jgi:hypothetical protein